MRRIYHVAVKEFIQIFRDPRMFGIIFIAPVIQLFLFGYAITLDVNNISVAVMDMDRSPESRNFRNRMFSSGYFRSAGFADTRQQLDDVLVSSRADLAVVIPKGFSKDINRGETARIQFLLDGSQSNTAAVALGYLNRILGDFNRDLLKNLFSSLGTEMNISSDGTFPVNAENRFLYNPELKSSVFFIPGVFGMILMVITMLLTSLAITREREAGTIEQLVVTPIRPFELIAGKLIPFALIGLIDVTLILTAAVLHFKLEIKGSVALLYLAAVVFLLATLGMGLLISTVSRTQQQAVFTVLMVLLPAVILSGMIFPIENMPGGIQWITYFNPLRYFFRIIRGIILKGNGLSELHDSFTAMFLLGMAMFIFAVLKFHKRVAD